MKRVTRWGVTLFLVALLPSFLFAGDVNGKWKGSMEEGGDTVFTLKSDKGVVTGTMLGQNGKEEAISEGKLDGDNISFTVASDWQGQPVKFVVTGTVSGDQMQLHIATDSGWATDATVKRESQ